MARTAISRACGAGVALVLTLTASGTSSEAAVFNPETFTLDNGMQVVVVTNRRAPVVSHHVWYKVGSADSPVGKSGLPHFLEHLMFKGTDRPRVGRVLARSWRATAATRTPSPAPDYTGYFQTIARDRLETVMRMEADRMTNLRPRARGGADRARRGARGALAAGRQRPGRAPRRDGQRHPVPEPSLPPADDRLAPRDGELHARGRARLLSHLVRAQQRRADRRRRHRRRRAAAAGREVLRRDPGAAGAGAPAARRAAAAGAARGRSRRPAGAAAVADPLLSRAELQRRRHASTPTRSRCWPRSSAAPAPRGSIARW